MHHQNLEGTSALLHGKVFECHALLFLMVVFQMCRACNVLTMLMMPVSDSVALRLPPFSRSLSRGDPPSFFMNRLSATVERPGWCLISVSVQRALPQMIERFLGEEPAPSAPLRLFCFGRVEAKRRSS